MLSFWVFMGDDFESNGGVADLKGMFASVEDAIHCVQDTNTSQSYRFDWYDIVNVTLGVIVRTSRFDASDASILHGLIVCPDETDLLAQSNET